ncbi:G-type lectin S-receptor-like serine/threonine-protein kinase SD2-5 [Humulus lupulus]|uniref:G-type lectin S-receptor-like serine/threonine-protein kinase SD2-5 n=1 Tax=Humulus lupulus TaxID=3486 RepID=UPI002B4018F9|nr:G-type lectin S-receptor-like serine/threonine-protein kinase SD2-5 [Humulus lupulus]XP_062097439.1 G-type lectin S-receptor-like serine/threonine-protein kinase SD2-5 [Humulus lupulus]XP_062097440.1 G-type lectin S-receptor-like serine/threonine-protein kinase SD2-5 [Humulus lupulus]
MRTGKFLLCLISSWLLIYLISETCLASVRSFGKIKPTFQGSQMNWIDNDGLFLLSNKSQFAFGFTTTQDVTKFLLVIVHMDSRRIIWTANMDSPVANSDKFVFNENGRVYLQKGGSVVWSIDTGGKGASAMELMDSGNLVLLGEDSSKIWESFDHPTDTLLWGQDFVEGMTLVSTPNSKNLSYFLEIKSGDMILSVGFKTPQPYWSMRTDIRKTINKDGRGVSMASIEGNSWKFYDKSRVLLWQFIFSSNSDSNATWIAALGNDGIISFFNLENEESSGSSAPIKIPSDVCSTPQHCDAFYECFSDNKCQCPSGLSSLPNCSTGTVSSCNRSKSPTQLINAGAGLYYFALGFVSPSLKGDLNRCKTSCQNNCSCVALFFQNSTGDCFMFSSVGNFQNSDKGSSFVSYIKVLSGGSDPSGSSRKHFPYVVIIAISTVLVICFLLYLGYRYYKKNKFPESPQETSEEDNFLETLSGMPVRFSYKDLQTATNNFTQKLGQGGFGSVYQGVLPDGTRLAVKKLEGIGQGKKEFRAEVSIIGSIHHIHLVRLRGFCAEGSHRLLAYEFMANGSLEKWIFRRNKQDHLLSWDTRFNIAVGTAKGLAYLHEDCDSKIIHCDIKPENVLLDDNYQAKVSDFGLAKLMTREQSHVFTTLRGTRGYLAPEWITNYAISEKSDVYSYGMLLLEIIGGRKNYDPTETSAKSHFPSFAFKMMEEGKLREILDWKLENDENDKSVSTAIQVALWCIQDDMNLRPSMTKVVQMLEGLSPVLPPPTSSPVGTRFFSGFLKSTSDEGTSSGPSEYNSDAHLSAVRLSGPR